MKGKKVVMQELQSMSAKDLVQMRQKLKRELHDLRTKNTMRALKETHKIGTLRVKIARINTVLTRKTSGNGDSMK